MFLFLLRNSDSEKCIPQSINRNNTWFLDSDCDMKVCPPVMTETDQLPASGCVDGQGSSQLSGTLSMDAQTKPESFGIESSFPTFASTSGMQNSTQSPNLPPSNGSYAPVMNARTKSEGFNIETTVQNIASTTPTQHVSKSNVGKRQPSEVFAQFKAGHTKSLGFDKCFASTSPQHNCTHSINCHKKAASNGSSSTLSLEMRGRMVNVKKCRKKKKYIAPHERPSPRQQIDIEDELALHSSYRGQKGAMSDGEFSTRLRVESWLQDVVVENVAEKCLDEGLGHMQSEELHSSPTCADGGDTLGAVSHIGATGMGSCSITSLMNTSEFLDFESTIASSKLQATSSSTSERSSEISSPSHSKSSDLISDDVSSSSKNMTDTRNKAKYVLSIPKMIHSKSGFRTDSHDSQDDDASMQECYSRMQMPIILNSSDTPALKFREINFIDATTTCLDSKMTKQSLARQCNSRNQVMHLDTHSSCPRTHSTLGCQVEKCDDVCKAHVTDAKLSNMKLHRTIPETQQAAFTTSDAHCPKIADGCAREMTSLYHGCINQSCNNLDTRDLPNDRKQGAGSRWWDIEHDSVKHSLHSNDFLWQCDSILDMSITDYLTSPSFAALGTSRDFTDPGPIDDMSLLSMDLPSDLNGTYFIK